MMPRMRIVRSKAQNVSLESLEDLIALFRAFPGIRETKPGIFARRRGKPWLHVHQDPDGLVADIRTGKEWERFHMSEPERREAFMAVIGRIW